MGCWGRGVASAVLGMPLSQRALRLPSPLLRTLAQHDAQMDFALRITSFKSNSSAVLPRRMSCWMIRMFSSNATCSSCPWPNCLAAKAMPKPRSTDEEEHDQAPSLAKTGTNASVLWAARLLEVESTAFFHASKDCRPCRPNFAANGKK